MEEVDIESRDQRYSGYLRVEAVKVRYRLADGSIGPIVDREVLVGRDAAVVLVRDASSGKYALVRQFRFAHYRNEGTGWMLEAVAGVMSEGESPEATARRETLEEIGIELTSVRACGTVYASPGTSTERYHLFLAEGSPSASTHKSEDDLEDIEVVWLSLDELSAFYRDGMIEDVKTLVLIQQLLLEQPIAFGARP